MRLKKSILAMVLSCLTILNVFTIPVMAAEPAASETESVESTLVKNGNRLVRNSIDVSV